ncbi:hypothetical protein [Secundilactobacillus muriivasis]
MNKKLVVMAIATGLTLTSNVVAQASTKKASVKPVTPTVKSTYFKGTATKKATIKLSRYKTIYAYGKVTSKGKYSLKLKHKIHAGWKYRVTVAKKGYQSKYVYVKTKPSKTGTTTTGTTLNVLPTNNSNMNASLTDSSSNNSASSDDNTNNISKVSENAELANLIQQADQLHQLAIKERNEDKEAAGHVENVAEDALFYYQYNLDSWLQHVSDLQNQIKSYREQIRNGTADAETQGNLDYAISELELAQNTVTLIKNAQSYIAQYGVDGAKENDKQARQDFNSVSQRVQDIETQRSAVLKKIYQLDPDYYTDE